MLLNFSHPTKIRVRYGETDQMGYCYYGNYAQYFEVGRVEALRSIGMSYKDMEDQGIMLPVSEFKVNYSKPAYYDDELTINTKITEIKGPRIFFEYEVKNANEEIIASASTLLVFVSKTNMRPVAPPITFLNLIENYVYQK